MIVMDSREASKNKDILYGLRKRVQVVVEKLELGDYVILVDPPIIVERMTDSEILSKRKMQQIKGMVQDNPEFIPFVLFEGRTSDIFRWRKIHPNVVYGKLISILYSWRVPLIPSENKGETVMWLSSLHQKATTKREKRPDVRPSPRRGATFREEQLWVLSSIRGLGASFADCLLDHFGSVRGVLNASVEELQAVKNIGKKKARRIVEVATGEEIDGSKS